MSDKRNDDEIPALRTVRDIFRKVGNLFTPVDRNYTPLNPCDVIEIGGAAARVDEYAEKYRPAFFLLPELEGPEFIGVMFDAVDAAGEVWFNYFAVWEDEIMPGVFDEAYRVFRTAYYGSKTDIEFVQVGVDKLTGEVVRVAFETDPSGRHDNPAARHDLVVAIRVPGGGPFSVSTNGNPAGTREIAFDGARPHVLVATWNHIYDFHNGRGILLPSPPLQPLTRLLYEKYIMSRRSAPPAAKT